MRITSASRIKRAVVDRFKGFFEKPETDPIAILDSLFDAAIPSDQVAEWHTPDLMELLRVYYDNDIIDQQFMEELQRASNRQDDQSDYRCTADIDCPDPPVWAHSVPENILVDLAETVGPFKDKRVYTITTKRKGPQIEPEPPGNSNAGFFSCRNQEILFQKTDGNPALSTQGKDLQILHGWKAIAWSLQVLTKTSTLFERRNQIILETWDEHPYLEEELQRILKRMTERISRMPFNDEQSKLIALGKVPKSLRDCIDAERARQDRATQSTAAVISDYSEGYLRSPGLIRTLRREVNGSPRLGSTAGLTSVGDLSILTLTVLPQIEMNNHVALVTFPSRLGTKPQFRALERLFSPAHTPETDFQVMLSNLITKTQNFSFRPSIYESYDGSVIDRLESSLWVNSDQPLLINAFNKRAGISQRHVNLFDDAGGTVPDIE